MAVKDNKPKAAAKGGAPKAKRKGFRINSVYTISGDKITKNNRSCPKCGSGVFLGKHKDRLVCGKCRYVEFVKS